MVIVKKILYKLLSQVNYLKFLNHSFFILYRIGFLKNDPAYRYHYFARNLVSEGDVVIDLGANLGYYTNLFRRWVGKNGSVYAVEPVAPFNEILHWKLKKYTNVRIYPYALGTEEKEITLIIPKEHKYLKTGLPHVFEGDVHGDLNSYGFKFKAVMKRGSELFKDIKKLDFIKCDIEGYEEYVLPELEEILIKYRPIIQVETWGSHKNIVESFLLGIGYKQYELQNGKLKVVDNKDPNQVDFIFIHPGNVKAMQKLTGLNT